MDEKTLVKTMSLPFGQPYAWYGDLNMVVLCPSLDDAGRKRAMDEVQAHWRRSCLQVVPDREVDAPEPNRVAPMVPPQMCSRDTQPLATLSQVGG